MDAVLVVEDCKIMQRILRRLLESGGLNVRVVSDGVAALESFQKDTPCAVILDLKLPSLPGRELCRLLKMQTPSVPVLVVSAIIDVAERVLLLELGADDYITKPFSPKELLARVRRFLRSSEPVTGNIATTHPPLVEALRFRDVHIDFARMRATRGGAPIELEAQEFELLKCFSHYPNKVFSKEELLKEVRRFKNSSAARVVEYYIFRLRNKLELDPTNPRHFLSLRGSGYKFCHKE